MRFYKTLKLSRAWHGWKRQSYKAFEKPSNKLIYVKYLEYHHSIQPPHMKKNMHIICRYKLQHIVYLYVQYIQYRLIRTCLASHSSSFEQHNVPNYLHTYKVLNYWYFVPTWKYHLGRYRLVIFHNSSTTLYNQQLYCYVIILFLQRKTWNLVHIGYSDSILNFKT